MYEKDSFQNSFDFFKRTKNIEINSTSSTILKMWAMTLYTLYKCVQFISFNKEKAFLALAVTVILTVAGFGVHHSNQEKKIAAVAVEQKNTEKIAMIKEIDQAQFEKIISHIKTTKEENLKAIKTAYWSAMYVNNEETGLNVERINREAREIADKTIRFYDNRATEITQAYTMIKANKLNLIEPTHDSADIIDLIMTWNNKTKVNNISIQKSITEQKDSWLRYLKNPVKMTEYLEKNKTMIENTKIF